MNDETQDGRPLALHTPLGKDKLLLIGFSGQEAISQPFNFRLETLAKNETEIVFEQLLGKQVTVELQLASGDTRHFNGIVNRVMEGARGPFYTEYALEVVPQLWLLTRKAQSRIFQHMSVPEILRSLFEGIEVRFELQGTFHPREFCVQYRETDLNFATRLMEEEGAFYFFEHTPSEHTMVVANTPSSHPEISDTPEAIYETVEGGRREADRITSWSKTQELRSGKYTLWDHHFQLPHKHLEADKAILASVQAGAVTHKLQVADNSKLELFDFPGEYAQRFDGVNSGGAEQSAELNKIFEDNQRTVEIRMQEEAMASVLIEGASNCRQLTSGHRFTLQKHFNADGAYVLTSVQHICSLDNYRSSGAVFAYHNAFTCIPDGLPFRPPRTTAKPIVAGTQSAVIVGPEGQEIFTDKYGRVKVQFHWDREGKNDAKSSCWVRVATHWAGKQWGIIHIPRIGQEVVVDFIEGDPDEPIIVGSVYNADMLPPYQLPDNKTQSGVKSRSTPGGLPADFNEIRFEDKKGSEQLYIHAQRNEDIVVESNKTERVGANETITIGKDRTETVGRDQAITIAQNDTLTVAQDQSVAIGKDQTVTVAKDQTVTIAVNQKETIGAGRTTTIGATDNLTVGANRSVTAGASHVLTAGAAITMSSGGVIAITSAGAIAITAPLITLNGRPVLPIPTPI
jgi:type VI secretion system secreted protein VgrG